MSDMNIPEDLKKILDGEVSEELPKSYYDRIIQWNKGRNNLSFDPALELPMLKEEASEFIHADTLPERIQEYCDFIFVFTGTIAKFFGNPGKTQGITEEEEEEEGLVNNFVSSTQFFEDILTPWANNFMNYAQKIIINNLQSLNTDEEHVQKIMDLSLEAVIDANEAKGTERDENGKICKGLNYVPPIKAIKKVIYEITGRSVV
jgi:hypothetical protein